MSKYDEIFASEVQSEQKLNSEEAVAAIIFAAMFAGKEINDEEMEYLNDILSDTGVFDSYSPEEIQQTLDKITDIYNEEGSGVLFNTAINSISDEFVEIAFEGAVAVVLAEENLPEEEESFVNKLQEALDIPEDVAQEIIDDFVSA
ncbi:hypothetical protein H6S82_17025 [Planktothrix sp. FACHB-1355]|uniref:Co-chaperone DjlA N-terminal domain-containing protein n=1 Tax=Aerosakkonema funiforme FACHB-1375 TaxID=2949571 RepID=A0A926ZLK1_9CYAN|nr:MULTISPECIES: hypothetical protein [Oscillatoriales]MBD2185151.1 hypothetical protein [Aerosakkonema funiforme FACHB-1375]MBD3560541.1 hypothetical protein [Planktothrix sp. FACHB-1355]